MASRGGKHLGRSREKKREGFSRVAWCAVVWCGVVQCGEASRVRGNQRGNVIDEGDDAGFNLLVVAHADWAVQLRGLGHFLCALHDCDGRGYRLSVQRALSRIRGSAVRAISRENALACADRADMRARLPKEMPCIREAALLCCMHTAACHWFTAQSWR
jgi:hypothetical protein